MSDIMDINQANLAVGAFIGAGPWPLAHLPKTGGGVTVLDAVLQGNSAGTAIGLLLVALTDVADGGTPALAGTIATFTGTCVAAAGVTFKATINNAYLATPCAIGVAQTSGTLPATANISMSYVMGK